MKIDVFYLRVICTCDQCDSPFCALQLTALIKPIDVFYKGVRKGGFGVKTPLLELDILQNFITCAKEINCFRILFAC